MKNSDLNQFTFNEIETAKEAYQKEEPKPICKIHLYAKETDLIDVTIKKTGRVVKKCFYCERFKAIRKMEHKKVWETEKKNLTDYYIRRSLVRGQKSAMPMEEYPDIIIEAKRAVIQLKSKIEKEKLPLKRCSKHGKLYKDDVIKAGITPAGTQQYKCRACMKEYHKANYELNKEVIRQKHATYRKENREKIAKGKRESRKRNKIKYMSEQGIANALFRHKMEREKNQKRLRDRKEVELLKDNYIKRKLKHRTNLKNEDIPQSLIEAKRAMLLLKRGIRKKEDAEIFNIMMKKEKLNVED